MHRISLRTAVAITGLTKRTLWRHIHNGSLAATSASEPGEKTLVRLEDVLPMSFLAVTPEDWDSLAAADRGDAVAQCELAIRLLDAGRAAAAIPWFTLSARQFYPDAMCFLGRCYLSGEGVARDLDAGVMWLSQAAAKGHPLAQGLMAFLHRPAGPPPLTAFEPAALNQRLDDIERRILLAALAETADTVGI